MSVISPITSEYSNCSFSISLWSITSGFSFSFYSVDSLDLWVSPSAIVSYLLIKLTLVSITYGFICSKNYFLNSIFASLIPSSISSSRVNSLTANLLIFVVFYNLIYETSEVANSVFIFSVSSSRWSDLSMVVFLCFRYSLIFPILPSGDIGASSRSVKVLLLISLIGLFADSILIGGDYLDYLL